MKNSLLQKEKVCYVTGQKLNLHKHHIFFGSNRSNSERYGCYVWLRADWHNLASYGVHFNKRLDLELKRKAQHAFEEEYGHEKFMEIFKRNYL